MASAEQSILMQENQPVKDIDLDLLQDVADQGQHMLTSGAHVPGLASICVNRTPSRVTFSSVCAHV